MIRRSFGSLRKLPSGRIQARYTNPETGETVNAPHTFETRKAADAYLMRVAARMGDGLWRDPAMSRITVKQMFTIYMDIIDVAPRTAESYQRAADFWILPLIGTVPLAVLDEATVAEWYVDAKKATRASAVTYYGTREVPSDAGAVNLAAAYRTLRQMLNEAVRQKRIPYNPCSIPGAGEVASKERTPATPEEVAIAAMQFPERYRVSVPTAAWSSFRPEELFALPRRCVDFPGSSLRIDQVLEELKGKPVRVKRLAKTDASLRTVHMPGWSMELLAEHMEMFTGPSPSSLVFTTTHGNPLARSYRSTLWGKARSSIGREDLRFYDLRHTGNKYAADTGATTRELMHRMGHRSTRAALIYQHHSDRADRELARRMESQKPSNVINLGARRVI